MAITFSKNQVKPRYSNPKLCREYAAHAHENQRNRNEYSMDEGYQETLFTLIKGQPVHENMFKPFN